MCGGGEWERQGGSDEVVPPADGWRMTDKRMIRWERVRQLDVTNGEGGSEGWGWGDAARAPAVLGGVKAPRLDMCARVETKIGTTC